MITSDRRMKREGHLTDSRIRLLYLDGLRGLSALYVVLYHASDPSWAAGTLSHAATLGRKLLVYGHFSVAVFIVLSGYCLMLPVARSRDRQLNGGWQGFVRRRARRILPPYYAALAVTLLLLAVVPLLRVRHNNYWDAALPAARTDVLVSHLTLVHTLTPRWCFKIDPPLWSVATEWQIYFCFAFLLLPVWQRRGMIATLAIALPLGLAPHFLLPAAWNLDCAVPWYLALFAFGMGAAVISFSPGTRATQWRSTLRWDLICGAQLILLLVAATVTAKWWWAYDWLADLQVGMLASCLLISLTNRVHQHSANWLLRLLDSRAATGLGQMSYSLYLIHAPLLALLQLPLSRVHCSPDARLLVMLCVNVPVTVALSYLFYLAVERRFTTENGPKASPNDAASRPRPVEHVG